MKKAILVLGAPRSGTSVVANIICELGVDFGDSSRFVDPESNTHNPIFFELETLNDLNNEIFEAFNKKWHEFQWVPTNEDFDEKIIDAFRYKIEKFVDQEFADEKLIGLKDPRFCFTLPIWDAVLKEKGYEIVYILAKRAGWPVFTSNQKVNLLPFSYNFRLISNSILTAKYFLNNKVFFEVDYENVINKPVETTSSLSVNLNLNSQLVNKASSVVNKNFDHFDNTKKNSLSSFITEDLYEKDISQEKYLKYREIFYFASCDLEEKINAAEIKLESKEQKNCILVNKNRELNKKVEMFGAEAKDIMNNYESEIEKNKTQEKEINLLSKKIDKLEERIKDLNFEVEELRFKN